MEIVTILNNENDSERCLCMIGNVTNRSCRVSSGASVELLLVLVPDLAHELRRHQPQLPALLHQPPHHPRRHSRKLDLSEPRGAVTGSVRAEGSGHWICQRRGGGH